MPDKYPIVLVEWEDAHAEGTLYDIDSPVPRVPYKRRSVGFLIQEEPNVLLAMTLDEGDTKMQDTLTILPGMVKKITRLRKRG